VSRSKAEHPRDQALLLRLTAEQRDVLESAAHLARTTPNGYAYKLLSDHLATLATQSHVAADRANRAAFDAAWAETVPISAADATTSHSRGRRGSSRSRRSAAPPA
jgi:uncharacterized protein (DUF1778 family)